MYHADTAPPSTDQIMRQCIVVLVVGFFAIFLDGFDLFALAYAAPHLIQEWNIANKAVLGPVFSANLVGMLVGAPICGWMADRWGRRRVVVGCCVVIGVPTLLVAISTNLEQLLVLRAIAGLGFGGIAPSLIALTAEFAPTRHRAKAVTLMYAGITVGAAAAGAAGGWIVPAYGWRALFWLGGGGALVMSAVCLAAVPTLSDQGAAPGASVRPAGAGKAGISRIFEGRLAAITPLIWVINVCILMAYYAISSWLPTLLSAAHRPADSAALFGMVFQIGGTLGGLALCRWIDKGKVGVLAVAFAAALPFVVAIVVAVDSDAALFLTVFLAGFCVMSIQYGINAVGALTYPHAIRSLGLGCSFAVSRLGAIVGPLLVSASLELGLAPVRSFLVACLPLGVGCVAALLLARRWSTADDICDVGLTSELKRIAPAIR